MQFGLIRASLASVAVMSCLLGPSSAFGQAVDEPTRPGRNHALIIGVSDYSPRQFSSLPHAEEDATDLADVLTRAGYIVTLMTETRAAGDSSLRGLAPKHDFIEDQLDLLLASEDLTERDTVIIALAGHGLKLIEDVDGNEVEHLYFCPADANKRVGGRNDGDALVELPDLTERNRLISVASIIQRLANCKAGQKLLLADICRRVSGDRTDGVTMPRMASMPEGVAAFFS
ncbi:MAG: caspase family protein, partial [Pirellulaceae bacterium]